MVNYERALLVIGALLPMSEVTVWPQSVAFKPGELLLQIKQINQLVTSFSNAEHSEPVTIPVNYLHILKFIE